MGRPPVGVNYAGDLTIRVGGGTPRSAKTVVPSESKSECQTYLVEVIFDVPLYPRMHPLVSREADDDEVLKGRFLPPGNFCPEKPNPDSDRTGDGAAPPQFPLIIRQNARSPRRDLELDWEVARKIAFFTNEPEVAREYPALLHQGVRGGRSRGFILQCSLAKQAARRQALPRKRATSEIGRVAFCHHPASSPWN